ncbi:MAG: hypothetical protein HC913_15480 [Microscillaceae bacterium]|nr:hypothetical protein [Microscillaceae bacterium]
MPARQDILARLAKEAFGGTALSVRQKPNFLHDVYINPPEEHIEVIFAENLQKQGGLFYYVESLEEALAQVKSWLVQQAPGTACVADTYLQALFKVAHIAFQAYPSPQPPSAYVWLAEILVARSGSLGWSLPAEGLENGVPHIFFAYSSQLVYDIQSALLILQEKHRPNFPARFGLRNGLLPGPAFGQAPLVVFLIDDVHEEFNPGT